MAMDSDFDFTLAPSGTIYPSRAVKLDATTEGACLQGSYNSPCIGVTPQQSEFAPGTLGNNTPPYVLAQTTGSDGIVTTVPIYSYGRRCLIDVDPSWGGQIKPGDFVICGNTGFGIKASPFGPWNQWIIGISTSFASGGQSCNIKVVIFPWSPTGS